MKSAIQRALEPAPPLEQIDEVEQRAAEARDRLLHIERCLSDDHREQLLRDVRWGLGAARKSLPPKYFYDDRGSRLFDAICDLPEYYPTRTEYALLRRIAAEVIQHARPSHLVELGSGASRKTHVLLEALVRSRLDACYVPVDVSEGMLRRSATALRRRYRALRVHAIVGDYDRHLHHFPSAERRLVAFLGSTIGNFDPAQADAFLHSLADSMDTGDFLLLGLDLVKPVPVLEAAYNDSAGITAEFNRNVLRVLNRELGADFDLALFEHVAFFNLAAEQIEMHLKARRAHHVRLPALDMEVAFAAGETIRTEISRKFRRTTAGAMLAAAGFRLDSWYTSPDGYFALALASLAGPP
jgi:L-histidine N-alpha-methyltransferase